MGQDVPLSPPLCPVDLLPFNIGMLFDAGSMGLMTRSLRGLSTARASPTWPSVMGRVEGSDTVRVQSTSSHRSVFVAYTYTDAESSYIGTRVAFYTLRGDDALDLSRRLQPLPMAPVFYDPATPRESTLVMGIHPDEPYSDHVLAGVGVAVALAAAEVSGAIG